MTSTEQLDFSQTPLCEAVIGATLAIRADFPAVSVEAQLAALVAEARDYVSDIEDADIRVLAYDPPDVPPCARTLEILEPRLFGSFEAGAFFGVEADRYVHVHLYLEQHGRQALSATTWSVGAVRSRRWKATRSSSSATPRPGPVGTASSKSA